MVGNNDDNDNDDGGGGNTGNEFNAQWKDNLLFALYYYINAIFHVN